MMSMSKALLVLALLSVFSADIAHCYRNGPFLDWLFHGHDEEKEPVVKETEGATSGSRTQLIGWFKIFVLGTGSACFSKDYQIGHTMSEQFGDFTSAEAFVEFFGEPECGEGAHGFAWGKVKASVVAAAYEKGGRECVSSVISSVITDPFHQFSHGDVSVRISGEAIGEAVALCESTST